MSQSNSNSNSNATTPVTNTGKPSLLKGPTGTATPPSSGKSKKTGSRISEPSPKPKMTRVTNPSPSDNDSLGNTINSSDSATTSDADLMSRFRRLKNKQ